MPEPPRTSPESLERNADRSYLNHYHPMRLIITTLLLPILVAGLFIARAVEELVKIRVLLITGDDVGSHDWLTCAVATREVLQDSGRFTVKVVGSPEVLAKPKALAKTDLIYFLMYNASTPIFFEAGKENRRRRCKDYSATPLCSFIGRCAAIGSLRLSPPDRCQENGGRKRIFLEVGVLLILFQRVPEDS